MRCTVRYYMTEAVVTYEDKPREQWLFDYPAQVRDGARAPGWGGQSSVGSHQPVVRSYGKVGAWHGYGRWLLTQGNVIRTLTTR